MTLQECSTLIRQQIGQAETAKALQSLISFLQQSPRHKAFLGIALNIQSLFSRTQQKEIKGTLTQDQASANYNIVNDSIIQVLDQLEQGLTHPKGFNSKVQTQRLQVWQVALTGVIAAGILAVVFLLWRPAAEPSAEITCPGFTQPAQLNVLLLPFVNLSEGELKPEYAIKERLEKYCGDYQLNTQVRVFETYYQRPDAELPNFNLAEEVGAECQAGLIIWGTAERLANGRIDLTSKFKFLGKGDQFALQKIQFEGETQVDTVLSISSIGRQGNITKDIEQLVLTLFGLVAHEEGNHEAAIVALEQTQASQGSDTSNVLLTQMVLADSYLATQQPEKAMASYDRVLKVHPDYTLARNNRGFLLLQDKKLDEAVLDFSNIIARQPDNKEALTARAAAYTELRETQKAETDFSKVRRIDPEAKLPVLKKVESYREIRRQ
ncbi:MAG: tetratricopeptide repeat protein [Saprospirales bacterium]|nr:tetratricopeptide repeat protein [Saprospirales bacterium]